jgi:LPS-assembly lipoprotein
MHKFRFFQVFCSLCLLFILTGCGFHLRGHGITLPFRTLYLESNLPYSNFSKELRQNLESLGVDVRLSPPAPITLQILSQDFTRTLTSLGNAGQTTTYLLSFTVLFQLVDRANQVLLPVQVIRATRNFSITATQLTGDLNTQTDLEEDMHQDAIQQLIARLSSPTLRQQLSQNYSFS